MTSPRLVTSLSEVLENFARYQIALSRGEMIEVISYVQHWYAVEEKSVWSFAPSKFIGYSGLTPKTYERSRAAVLNGRDTERVLNAWFTELPAGHPLEAEIMQLLRARVAVFGKSVNGRAKVHVLKERMPAFAGGQKDKSWRITSNPEVLSGKPCLRGLRIRVSDVLEMLAFGASRNQILEDYPYLEDGDITAALAYAASAVDHRLIKAA